MFLAIALPVLATLIGSLATVDLTYLIRAGNEIFATGAIPNADTWTFTAAGLPWVDQQWGAEVILAAVYNVAGWTGLVLVRAVLVAIIFGCVYAISRRRGLSRAHLGPVDARDVRRRGGGPRPPRAGVRDGLLRRRCCSWSPSVAPTRA